MRTQIALDDAQHSAAKTKAAELGITLAEYIRRLVDRDLRGPQAAPDISEIIGIGASGGSDIARDKDRVLAETLAARPRR